MTSEILRLSKLPAELWHPREGPDPRGLSLSAFTQQPVYAKHQLICKERGTRITAPQEGTDLTSPGARTPWGRPQLLGLPLPSYAARLLAWTPFPGIFDSH